MWGGVLGPQFFPVWILAVLVSAALLHQFFVTVRKVPFRLLSATLCALCDCIGWSGEQAMRASVVDFALHLQNKKVGEISDKVAKKIIALVQ